MAQNSEKAQNNLPLFLTLLSKCQDEWDIQISWVSHNIWTLLKRTLAFNMKFISTYKIYLYLLIFEFSLNSILIILTSRNNNRIWRGKKEFKAKKGEKKEKNDFSLNWWWVQRGKSYWNHTTLCMLLCPSLCSFTLSHFAFWSRDPSMAPEWVADANGRYQY